MDFITLNSGCKMPLLGIGTFNDPGDDAAERAVGFALKTGYRLIDTAHAYGVERGVGRAINKSGVAREEIFLTSKLWPSEYGEGKAAAGIDAMLKRLDTDYLDLLLLHQPFGDVVGAWRDMERAVAAGRLRSIGISNFEKYNLNELLDAATIMPAVMQVECHPYHQQVALREKIASRGMALESWYPLGGKGEGGKELLFSDPVIAAVAAAHGKTPAQILLRWHTQRGFIAIPGSVDPAHIAENFDIFDFTLTDEETAAINALEKGQRFFTAFEQMSYDQILAAVTSAVLAD